MVLFFAHIPFVVNHTFNATPPERLQQYWPGYRKILANRFKHHHSTDTIRRPPHGLHGLMVLDEETIERLLNTYSEI